ncbi:MAG: Gfo/Idh/MocA family oxidoreductase [bacterium]|nr:oxidoreductase [Deltaproteobacteria bacterium]MCP4907952.1 Gfo/Idh/MocA family oxidoreductase [bacterium]
MIRFALVGCGNITQKHATLIGGGKVPGAELAAVCDLNIEAAKKFGEEHGVPWFGDMHEMMGAVKNDVDVISLLTPAGVHAANCLELTQYGKAILVEKPMALTLRDADLMIEACDKAGVALFVVKQNRLNRPVVKVRESLERGRFGQLVLGTVRVRWRRDQEYYDAASWRGTWAQDGGVFANQAIHHVDLLIWMMGDVESVYAKASTALVDIEAEDTGVVVVKFCNGALGIIEATTATRPDDLEGSVSILGSGGSVEIGGFAMNDLRTYKFVEPEEGDAGVFEEHGKNPRDEFAYAHQEYLRNIVRSLEGGRAALVDGLEGRKSLEVVSAIYESIETGKEVLVRFIPQRCRLGLSS